MFGFVKAAGSRALQHSLTEGLPELEVGVRSPRGVDVEDGAGGGTGDKRGPAGGRDHGQAVHKPGGDCDRRAPIYLAAIQAFIPYRANYLEIPIDERRTETGASKDEIERLIGLGEKLKLTYVVPTCQNPVGISVSMDRRKHILESTSRYDLHIPEDDLYGRMVLEDATLKRLKSMNAEERMIRTSTLSRMFAPGIRLGWAVASREVVGYMALAKQTLGTCPPNPAQHIAYHAPKTGDSGQGAPAGREAARRGGTR